MTEHSQEYLDLYDKAVMNEIEALKQYENYVIPEERKREIKMRLTAGESVQLTVAEEISESGLAEYLALRASPEGLPTEDDLERQRERNLKEGEIGFYRICFSIAGYDDEHARYFNELKDKYETNRNEMLPYELELYEKMGTQRRYAEVYSIERDIRYLFNFKEKLKNEPIDEKTPKFINEHLTNLFMTLKKPGMINQLMYYFYNEALPKDPFQIHYPISYGNTTFLRINLERLSDLIKSYGFESDEKEVQELITKEIQRIDKFKESCKKEKNNNE